MQALKSDAREGRYDMRCIPRRVCAPGLKLAAVASAVFVTAAFYNGLVVRKYVLKSRKLATPVRLALITDLHGCYYGQNQIALLTEIDAQKPDAVVMAGDILDERMPVSGVLDLIEGLKGKYPSYYSAGNHEYRTRKLSKVKAMFASYGVNVLDGVLKNLEVKGGTVSICGVDDFEAGAYRFRKQLEKVRAVCDVSRYNVLLSHRPEKIPVYADYGFDLVLCGHAHGGQWRLPYILNGVYAPEQGFFPKYAGGKYMYGTTSMIVSRGLARESTPLIPRIFNPPELVIADIVPE